MLFTPENSRHFSAIGIQKQREKRKADQSRLDLIDFCLRKFAELPAVATAKPDDSEEVRSRALARVRSQIETVNERLEQCLDVKDIDPQAVDRLSACLARLSDMHFALANWPKPKPADVEQPGRTRPGTDPLDRGLLGAMVPPPES